MTPKNVKTHSTKSKPRARILSVTVRRVFDEDPDTSYLGEYSDKPSSYAIDRALDDFVIDIDAGETILERVKNHLIDAQEDIPAESPSDEESRELADLEQALETIADCQSEFEARWDSREYRYFRPSFNYVDKNGDPRPENTPEDVRKYVRQDYERMERLNAGDWCYLGVTADAEIGIPNGYTNGKEGSACYTMQRITSGGLWGIESDSKDSYIAEEESNQLADLREQLAALGLSKRAIAEAFKSVQRKER